LCPHTGKHPIVRAAVASFILPFLEHLSQARSHRDGLHGELRLATAGDTMDDRSHHVGFSTVEVQVSPSQAERFALTKTRVASIKIKIRGNGPTASRSCRISSTRRMCGTVRRLALWRTRWMGLSSKSSYLRAWLNSTLMMFLILAQDARAKGSCRSHNSTSIGFILLSWYSPHLGTIHRFR
jgi:hypothetical protein